MICRAEKVERELTAKLAQAEASVVNWRREVELRDEKLAQVERERAAWLAAKGDK